jgi:hypothetical protein
MRRKVREFRQKLRLSCERRQFIATVCQVSAAVVAVQYRTVQYQTLQGTRTDQVVVTSQRASHKQVKLARHFLTARSFRHLFCSHLYVTE